MSVEGGVCLVLAPDVAGGCDGFPKWRLECNTSKGEVFYR